MKKYIRILFIIIFVIFINTKMLFAEEISADSYIVKYKDNTARLFSESENLIDFTEDLYLIDARDIERYEDNPNIEYIEPNYDVELFGCLNDEYYNEQWSLKDWGYNDIFKIGTMGMGVKVGIIDSGVDVSHPDLNNISADSYNIIDNNDNIEDTYGHGTFVCGVIGAEANNKIGIAGIAPEAEIVMIKCFSGKTTKVSYVISAMNYAADLNLDVVNMSFGLSFSNPDGSNSKALKEAVDELYNSGTIMIAAVGNSGNSTLYYPAAYENVIGVGSVNSNYETEASSQKNESVFVTAPGENIIGLWSSSADENMYYNNCSGTSFASPYIAGLAALAKEKNKALSFTEICQLFENSVKDLGEEGYDIQFGWGVVNPKVFKDNVCGGTKVYSTQPVCDIINGHELSCKQFTINNSEENARFYYALYENGKIVEIKESEFQDITKVTFENEITDKTTVKCFVWNNLNDLNILYNSLDIR